MALRRVSTALLRRELARREKGATKLQQKHSKLAARLAEIESELVDLGVNSDARRGRSPGRPAGRRGPGRPPGRRGPGRPRGSGHRGRARNALSLSEALAKAVRVGSTVSPAEAMSAVKRIYKTASKSFNVQVTNALAKSPAFKKLGRAQYQRKGGADAPAKRGAKSKMGGRGGRKAKRGRKPSRKAARRGRPTKAAAAAPAAKPAS